MTQRLTIWRFHDTGGYVTTKPRHGSVIAKMTKQETWTQNLGPQGWARKIAQRPVGGFPY